MPHLDETGAELIGLFRTELQFMLAAELPAHRRAGSDLSRGARRSRRPHRHVSHARHRRRQGAALYEAARRGESGARLAGDSHRARPAGPAAHPVPGHAARGRRPRAQGDDPDGVDRRRVLSRRATCSTRKSPSPSAAAASRPTTSSSARWSRCRRCCGRSTRSPATRRLPLGRLQRPDAVCFRRRPRQQARRRPLRRAVAELPARAEVDRRRRRAAQHAGHAVRRNGRPAARAR